MGRNPLYADYVVPIHCKPSLPDLEDLFALFFRLGEVGYYDDDDQVATLPQPIYLRILQSEYMHLPLLERSCSVYRKVEDYFPKEQHLYQVVAAVRHRFRNQYSGHQPFEYRVLEIVNTDPEYHTTFCIRTDGALLNLESLSLRGYATHVRVVHSTEQLCVG